MKILYAISALIAVAVVKAQSPIYTNCAPPVTGMTLSSFSVSPYPACINKSFCLTATGTLNNPITAGATVSAVGKLLSSTIFVQTLDLCSVLAAQGIQCPVAVIPISIHACFTPTPTVPVNVGLSMQFSATNGGNLSLFCQQVSGFKFISC